MSPTSTTARGRSRRGDSIQRSSSSPRSKKENNNKLNVVGRIYAIGFWAMVIFTALRSEFPAISGVRSVPTVNIAQPTRPEKESTTTTRATAQMLPAKSGNRQPPPFHLPSFLDNDRIPGPFWNDKLYIVGMRLTTSHDKFDESVSLDMFGHAVGEGASGHNTLDRVKPTGSQLSFKRASLQPLYCQLRRDDTSPKRFVDRDNSTHVLMEFIPTVSDDSNTAGNHLIWRCDISPFLSKTSMRQLDRIRVSVLAALPNTNSTQLEHVCSVDVPVDTANVGHAGPFIKSRQQPSFVEQVARDGPVGVVLCAGGLRGNDVLTVLPEFVQHHINVGAGHIVLGICFHNDGLLEKVQALLSHYIDRGIVVLAAATNTTGDVDPETFSDVSKVRFYDQCLYHAKGMSEYVLNADIDELWIPPEASGKSSFGSHDPQHAAQAAITDAQNDRLHRGSNDTNVERELWKQSPYRHALSLAEAVRSMRGVLGCTEWCYQTFPSFTVQRQATPPHNHNADDIKYHGYYGFPVRDAAVNYIWQKPVIRTSFAFVASFHLGGSCRRPRHTNVDLEEGDQPYFTQFPDCMKMDTPNAMYGKMHHYFSLFRGGVDEQANLTTPVDDYSQLFRATTLRQLHHMNSRYKPQL